jgi:hypothetical protein
MKKIQIKENIPVTLLIGKNEVLRLMPTRNELGEICLMIDMSASRTVEYRWDEKARQLITDAEQ